MNFNPDTSKIILEDLIKRADIPVLILKKDFNLKSYNMAFEGLGDSQRRGTHEFLKDIIEEVKKRFSVGEDPKEIRCPWVWKSGSEKYLRASLVHGKDEIILVFDSFLMGESKIVSEISRVNIEMSNLARELARKNYELKEANERITQMLTTDSLTGAANRRFFFKRLDELISLKKRRDNFEIGIVYIDIDFFKEINDNYGHSTGDLVLKEFSKMLKDNLRREDIVARIGGEEFCVITRCSKEDCLFEISEKLRSRCKAMEIRGIYEELTASFGATLYRRWEDVSSLVKRADRNMYEAKKGGRNQVVFKR